MPTQDRIRLGLALAGEFRPLLGISISGDGGLILGLSRYAPLKQFRYGVIDIPTGKGSYTVPPRDEESGWAEGLAPKVHYHRSGELSVNSTGRLERFRVRGTSLDDIREHLHTFIFMVRRPEAWDLDPLRSADAAFRVDGPLHTLTVNGYVGRDLREPHASNPQNPFGLDTFTGGEGPAVLLHAFDPISARDTTTTTETIATRAVSDE
jgi:hypothetical protein